VPLTSLWYSRLQRKGPRIDILTARVHSTPANPPRPHTHHKIVSYLIKSCSRNKIGRFSTAPNRKHNLFTGPNLVCCQLRMFSTCGWHVSSPRGDYLDRQACPGWEKNPNNIKLFHNSIPSNLDFIPRPPVRTSPFRFPRAPMLGISCERL
jgi:hypothetical protein